MDSAELLAQDHRTAGRVLSYKRRCLQSMIVGQTSVFYPDRGDTGDEHAIAQCANERWVKDAGWKFSIETGCFVSRADMSSRKCILITRTA